MNNKPLNKKGSLSLDSYFLDVKINPPPKYEGTQNDLLYELWADVLDISPMPVKISEVEYEKPEEGIEEKSNKDESYTGKGITKEDSQKEGDDDE